MKEKTFEELIEEQLKHEPNYIRLTVEALMQQVREATITECADVAREYWTSPEFHIKQLPKDRILTT